MEDVESCPCGTGRAYASCCGRWHSGRQAPTAVALMRARYSAYARGKDDFLLATWHPSTRPDTVDVDPQTVWTGLSIVASSGGKAWDGEGTVEFRALFTSPEGQGELREISRFVFDGRWFYLDGTY